MRLISILIIFSVITYTSCTTPSVLATKHIQLGDAMNNANKYDEAIKHYEEYLALSPQLGLYRNATMEATVYRKLAHALSTQGRYRKAEAYLKNAIAIDSVQATNGFQLSEDYRLMGLVNAYAGNYHGAISHFNKSLTINEGMEKSIKENRKTSIADTYVSLAQVHLSLGNFVESRDLAMRALHIYSTVSGEFKGTIEVKLLLGIVAREINQLDESVKLCQASKQLALQYKLNTSRQDQALGEVYFLKGEFEEGVRYKLLAIEQAELSNIKPQIIIAYMRMGDAYRQLGDEKKANDFYRRAMDIQNTLMEENATSGTAQSLNLRLGNIDQAYTYYSQSGSTIGAALVYLKIGTLQLQQHNLDSSLIMLEQAKEYFKRSNHAEGIAKTNLELARVFTGKQSFLRAESLLLEARQLTRQADMLWQIYLRRGILFETSGKYDSAFVQYQKAIGVIDGMRGNLTIEEFKTAFANTKVEVYDRIIMLLLTRRVNGLSQQAAIERAFLYSEESRSRAFLDMLGNRKIDAKASIDASLLDQEQLLRLKIQQLVQELNKKSDTGNFNLVDELHKTQSEHNAIVQRIKLSNPAYSSIINVNPIPVREIQDALDSKTAVLQYWVSTEKIVIWILSKNTLKAEIIPIGTDELKREVSLCRAAIAHQVNEQSNASLRKLYQWLIQPVKSKISAFKALVIIPHKNLHFLPFQALTSEAGKFLVEEYVLQSVPSSSIFYYCTKRQVTMKKSFLGFALGDFSVGGYHPLPGTELEIEHVAKLYDNFDLKSKVHFTEQYVKDNISEHGFVHIATHGIFNKLQPMYSYLLMSPDTESDGRLTVDEIFSLNFQGRVIALSACETALGDLSDGDELVGLSRAFIYAGSPSVVVSLWKIDDATSAWLMIRFYQYLQSGLTAAESLTFAQRDFIQRNFSSLKNKGLREIEFDKDIQQITVTRNNARARSPFFWAPFILVGNGAIK
jgi:CHAT domain-containing protein/Tfp pilus assembly protein PilF